MAAESQTTETSRDAVNGSEAATVKRIENEEQTLLVGKDGPVSFAIAIDKDATAADVGVAADRLQGRVSPRRAGGDV